MAKVEAARILAGCQRRPAALGVWVTEDAERLWQRLRLTNAEHARLTTMATDWWQVSPAMGDAAHALIYRIGPEGFTERVLLAWSRSDAAASDEAWRDLALLPQRWSAPTFPLRAKDFVARGVEKGPSLGAALARAEDAWIAAGFPLEKAALAAIVDATCR